MLVLTRKKGERVLIGDDIVITLIDVRGDGVRIGFDAPRGVKIQRAEVLSAVTAANTEAASTSAATGDLLVGFLATKPKTSGARVEQPPATAATPQQQPADADGTPGTPKPQPPKPRG